MASSNFFLVECYVTGDEANAKDRVLYFLTDIFGIRFINSQLLADHYGEAGFYVIIPDLFDGDAMTEADMNPPPGVNVMEVIGKWMPKHMPKSVDPIIEKVIAQTRATHNPKFSASVGYCFGGKYSVRLLAQEGVLQSAALFHPSMLEDAEVDAIVGKNQTLFVCSPDNDSLYTKTVRRRTEDQLQELSDSTGLRYKTVLLHGVGHGFAVRGDISDPWTKFSKEQAFTDAVAWLKGSEKLLA